MTTPPHPRVFLFGAGASRHAGYPLLHEIKSRAVELLPGLQTEREHTTGDRRKTLDQVCGFIEAWLNADFDEVRACIAKNASQAGAAGSNRVDIGVVKTVNALNEFIQNAEAIDSDFEFFATFLDLIDAIQSGSLVAAGYCDYPHVRFPRALRYGGQALLHFVLNGERDSRFCEEFCTVLKPGDTLVTTNYDILLDRALIRSGLWSPFDGYGEPHWFLDRDKPAVEQWMLDAYESPSKVLLLKLHGSINWTMENWFLAWGPVGSGFWIDYAMLDERLRVLEDTTWSYLENEYAPPEPDLAGFIPAIIPPLFLKQTGAANPTFGRIYQQTVKALSLCRSLIAIGYSFPPSDNNVGQLVEACIRARTLDTLVVVNPDPRVHERLRNRWGAVIEIQSVDCKAEEFERYRVLL